MMFMNIYFRGGNFLLIFVVFVLVTFGGHLGHSLGISWTYLGDMLMLMLMLKLMHTIVPWTVIFCTQKNVTDGRTDGRTEVLGILGSG